MNHHTPLILVCMLVLTFGVAAEDTGGNPADLYPSGLGFSFSNLTGQGFSYRLQDSTGGVQVTAQATNRAGWWVGQHFYGLGLAKSSVLFSFVPTPWFASQFYWLGGISWKSFTNTLDRTKPNPHPTASWDDTIYYQVTRWNHRLIAGPALGIEINLLSHFSFNFEVNYELGYNFVKKNPVKAFSADPGFSTILYYRF